MNNSYDVAIIGAGAMGSAATYHLSKTGKKILVLDQFTPPHNLGSSHGQSRIMREAYFESPIYVPFVQQAYGLWNQLEKEYGKQLFLKTGGLMLGDKGSKVFAGAEHSAVTFNVWYEVIDSSEIKKRFPAFRPTEDTMALYERNAGLLFPEECIKAHLSLSKDINTNLHFNEKVISVGTTNDTIEIETNKGIYDANKIIVSAGAWLNKIFPELQLPLSVSRQVLFWFDFETTNPESFSPERFPVYIWEHERNNIFYGFPAIDNKLKIAIDHQGKISDADTIDRTVQKDEVNQVKESISTFFDVRVSYSHAAVCMYTNTPTEDFIIDFHPSNKNIVIASPCSGHGFKFSSAIGKILSEMVCDEPLSFDISAFSIKRQK